MTNAIPAQSGWFLLVDYGDGKSARVPIIAWDISEPYAKPITLRPCGNGIGLYYLEPNGGVSELDGGRHWDSADKWRAAMRRERGEIIPEVPRLPTHLTFG